MNFFCDSNRHIFYVTGEPVYQGGKNANTFYFVGAIPKVPVSVAYKMPNGTYSERQYLTRVNDESFAEMKTSSGQPYNVWKIDVPDVITQYPGTVNIQFFVHTANGDILPTNETSFDVLRGVPIDELPKVNITQTTADYFNSILESFRGEFEPNMEYVQEFRVKAENGDFDGKDGISVTHEWDGTTLVVTSASGTSSANLKGEIGEGVETMFKTAVVSTNLLDITKVEEYSWLNKGNTEYKSDCHTFGYMPCKAGDTIRLQFTYNGQRFDAEEKPGYGNIYYLNAFDKDKNYIEGSQSSYITTFVCPENTAYVRVSLSKNMVEGKNGLSDLAIVIGNTATIIPYEEYKETLILKAEHSNDAHIEEIARALIPEQDTDKSVAELFKKAYSTNLLDLSQIEQGYYLNTNGALASNSSYCTSGFIPCKAGDTIRFQFTDISNAKRYDSETHSQYAKMVFACAYDNYKVAIADSHTRNPLTYTCPEGTAFVRVSFYQTTFSNAVLGDFAIIISDNSIVLPYEEYSERDVLKDEHNNDDYIAEIAKEAVGNGLDLYLPKNIYCAVGRTIELYNNQVCLQADKYYLRWDCTIGKALSRKFSVTGVESQIGTYPLSLAVYNGNLEIVGYAETTLNIVKGTIANNYTVCPIGDSLTNAKPWEAEVMSLSSRKISFVGTYNATVKDSNDATVSYSHEGRSGFSAGNYLTATKYSYGGETTAHAFWNGSRFDWNYYKSNSGKNPNAVQIFLGTNSIADNNTANASNIKQIVDYIRQDDASIPIFVVNTIYRGNQNGIGVQQSNDGYGYASQKGVFKFNEDRKVMDLMKRLDALLEGKDNVHLVNLALTHDSEYNFGAVETAVNPRAAQKELMPVESVHPQNQGYFQMADYIYSVYCAVLN